jgi:hypothetical protein
VSPSGSTKISLTAFSFCRFHPLTHSHTLTLSLSLSLSHSLYHGLTRDSLEQRAVAGDGETARVRAALEATRLQLDERTRQLRETENGGLGSLK